MTPIKNAVTDIRSRLQNGSGLITRRSSDPQKVPESSTSSPRMVQVWVRFAEIYGHKWTSQYGDKYLESWAAGLSGLTAQELANGFRWCVTQRNDPWPPSLPEFRSACIMGAFDGLPSGDEAYRLGVDYASAVQYGRDVPETIPAIAEACRQATCLALISAASEQSRRLFAYHYGRVLEAMASGFEPQAHQPKALEHAPRTDPEVVSEWCNRLRGALK